MNLPLSIPDDQDKIFSLPDLEYLSFKFENLELKRFVINSTDLPENYYPHLHDAFLGYVSGVQQHNLAFWKKFEPKESLPLLQPQSTAKMK